MPDGTFLNIDTSGMCPRAVQIEKTRRVGLAMQGLLDAETVLREALAQRCGADGEVVDHIMEPLSVGIGGTWDQIDEALQRQRN